MTVVYNKDVDLDDKDRYYFLFLKLFGPKLLLNILRTRLVEYIFCAMFFSVDAAVLFPYDSISDVGESRVWWRADFRSGSRVLKKVF